MASIGMVKIAVLGGDSVGKTALIVQLCLNKFVETYDPTIEDLYRKRIVIHNEPVTLDIMDTSGSEQYTALRAQWIRDCEGILLVYSVTERASFARIAEYYRSILTVKEESPVPLILVGNKTDEVSTRVVPTEEGQRLAQEWGVGFVETSAKLNINAELAFKLLTKVLLNKARSEHSQHNKKIMERHPERLPSRHREAHHRSTQGVQHRDAAPAQGQHRDFLSRELQHRDAQAQHRDAHAHREHAQYREAHTQHREAHAQPRESQPREHRDSVLREIQSRERHYQSHRDGQQSLLHHPVHQQMHVHTYSPSTAHAHTHSVPNAVYAPNSEPVDGEDLFGNYNLERKESSGAVPRVEIRSDSEVSPMANRSRQLSKASSSSRNSMSSVRSQQGVTRKGSIGSRSNSRSGQKKSRDCTVM